MDRDVFEGSPVLDRCEAAVMKMIEMSLWKVSLDNFSVQTQLHIAAFSAVKAISGAVEAAREDFQRSYDESECSEVSRVLESIWVPGEEE